jgi:hypothetical protein
VAAVDGNQHDDTKQKQPGETAGDAGKYLRPGRCIAPARIGWFVCYGRGDVPEAFAARLFVAIEVGSTGTSRERKSPAANTPANEEEAAPLSALSHKGGIMLTDMATRTVATPKKVGRCSDPAASGSGRGVPWVSLLLIRLKLATTQVGH